ncbi:MAG: hypothetical protein PHW01_01310 [Patescibacteria group bacterium]|nr:hypothetical protein [Patescibacteria group bacterium]
MRRVFNAGSQKDYNDLYGVALDKNQHEIKPGRLVRIIETGQIGVVLFVHSEHEGSLKMTILSSGEKKIIHSSGQVILLNRAYEFLILMPYRIQFSWHRFSTLLPYIVFTVRRKLIAFFAAKS